MGRWFRALGALVVLAALIVGLPVLLVVIGGWPLPTRVPDWGHARQMITQGEIQSVVVVKTLCVVLWLLWLAVLWSFLWEFAAAIATNRGRRPERPAAPLVPSGLSFGIGRLVAAVLAVGILTHATASTAAAAAPLMPASIPVATATITPPASVTAPATPSVVTQAQSLERYWSATATDTLWDIAETALGDPARVDEIITLNPDVNPARALRDGQRVTLPADANIPSARRPANQPVPTTPVDVGSATATVEPGDTMWDLAADHLEAAGEPVTPATITGYLADVIDANPDIANPNLIFPGQAITLPAHSQGAPTPAAGTTDAAGTIRYDVVEGDTLWGILAAHYGERAVTAELVWSVADLNGLENPDLILVGQQLVLPTTPTPAADPAPVTEPVVPVVAPEPAADTPTVEFPPPILDEVLPAPTPPPPPTTTPPTTSPPATTPTAPVAAAQPSDEQEQVAAFFDLTSRTLWWGLGISTLLAAGVLANVRRLRGRRLAEVPIGEQIVTPSPVAAGTELAIASASAAGRVSTLHSLLCSVTPHARELDDPPPVRAVEISNDQIEILFADPAPFPPSGWRTADGGRSWTYRTTGTTAPTISRQIVTPTLVTIGHRDDSEVLLDLETAGSVAVHGDRDACLDLARSMVLELGGYPLGVPIDIGLVGFALDGAERTDRTWEAQTMPRAVRVAREMLDRTRSTGATSLLAARAEVDDDDGTLDPHVFVVDVAALDDDARPLLDELIELCQPQAGAAVIVVGDHDQAHEHLTLTTAGTITWSGMKMCAPQVSREAAAQVAVLYDHAAAAATEPIGSSVVQDLLVAFDQQPLPDLGIPAAVDVDAETSDPAAPADEQSADEPAESGDDEFDDDLTDPVYVPPRPDVVVRVMGEVTVEGRTLNTVGERELLCLLACLRDRRPNVDTIAAVLDVDLVKSMQRRLRGLIRLLGVGSDGEDLMGGARLGRGSAGTYPLSPLVMTDIELLGHRYQASLTMTSADAMDTLEQGLDLMRGPMFRGRSGYSWATTEGVAARAANLINAYATRLMELAFEAGQLDLVLDASKRAGEVIQDAVLELPMRRHEKQYAEATQNPDLLHAVELHIQAIRDYQANTDALAPTK